MRKLWLIPMGFLALAVPCAVLAAGGDGGFNGVVRGIEGRYGAHATRIPFMGLISLISRRATDGGVSNMHVAEFDSFKQHVDGSELNQLVEDKLGSGWERMVRETSKHNHDQTLIFTRAEGSRMGMFVVDLDGDEMDVVQLSVDPSHLGESMVKYSHHHDSADAVKRESGEAQPE